MADGGERQQDERLAEQLERGVSGCMAKFQVEWIWKLRPGTRIMYRR